MDGLERMEREKEKEKEKEKGEGGLQGMAMWMGLAS